jgi:hypothetical protein
LGAILGAIGMGSVDLVETLDQFRLTFTSTWTLFYGGDTIDVSFSIAILTGRCPALQFALRIGRASSGQHREEKI